MSRGWWIKTWFKNFFMILGVFAFVLWLAWIFVNAWVVQ